MCKIVKQEKKRRNQQRTIANCLTESEWVIAGCDDEGIEGKTLPHLKVQNVRFLEFSPKFNDAFWIHDFPPPNAKKIYGLDNIIWQQKKNWYNISRLIYIFPLFFWFSTEKERKEINDTRAVLKIWDICRITRNKQIILISFVNLFHICDKVGKIRKREKNRHVSSRQKRMKRRWNMHTFEESEKFKNFTHNKI